MLLTVAKSSFFVSLNVLKKYFLYELLASNIIFKCSMKIKKKTHVLYYDFLFLIMYNC